MTAKQFTNNQCNTLSKYIILFLRKCAENQNFKFKVETIKVLRCLPTINLLPPMPEFGRLAEPSLNITEIIPYATLGSQ